MYKFCESVHWRLGTNIKILIADSRKVRIPSHGMSVSLISFEPPKMAMYNLNVNDSGIYRCYCENFVGKEEIDEFGIVVRHVSSSQEFTGCDFSSCSTCITDLIVPIVCVILVLFVVFMCLIVYFNRFRLIYTFSKLRW